MAKILGEWTVKAMGYLFHRFQVKSKAKALEAELIERKKYEELKKLKSDLLSMVSHELHTPLATVSLQLQLVRLYGLYRLPDPRR